MMTPRFRRSGRLLSLILGALFLFRTLHSAAQKSPTFDEPCFVAAGYSYLRTLDFRMNPEHPPFAQMLMGVPLLLVRPDLPLDDPSWASSQQGVFGWQFLFRRNDADRVIFLARIPTMILVLLAAALVYGWARRLYGTSAAVWALLLFTLEPNVLAHGRLATTDVAAMLGIFGSLYFITTALDTGAPTRYVLAWATGSFAFVSKYSTAFLLPCIVIVSAIGIARSRVGRARLARHGAIALCGLIVIGYAAIWAAYGFRYRAAREEGVPFFIPWKQIDPRAAFIKHAFAWMRWHRVLPEGFIYGAQRALVTAGRRPSFLCGRYSDTGWWYYFLVTFALKTPLSLLVLLGAQVGVTLRTRGRGAPAGLWAPPLLYFLWSLTSHLNIGHRHLLPIYPFIAVMGGGCAAALNRQRRLVPRVVLGALAAWYALSSASIHPHYLAYFNELCGGPSEGYRYLVDSNLDWGQDLKGLKEFMDQRGIQQVKLSYFGTADPDYYGIDYVYLPSFVIYKPRRAREPVDLRGYIAISATNLQGVYAPPRLRALFAKFRKKKPLGVVGHSIFVYNVP